MYSVVLETTPLLVLELDLHGHVTAINPAAAALAGLERDQLLGLPLARLLDPGSHAKATLLLERARAETVVRNWELDHLRPGTTPVLINYTVTTLHDASGAVCGFGMIGHDQSDNLVLTSRLAYANQQLEGALLDLEKAHAELQATQTRLVQSEKMRALGQMVAGMAHEVNNPAAFVINNLAHLARLLAPLKSLFDAYRPLRDRATAAEEAAIAAAEQATEITYLWNDLGDLVHESQQGMQRIHDIVLSLRSFARLDEAAWKQADLNACLDATLRMVRHRCVGRIRLVEEYGKIPQILCHPGELNQVFLNLLTNAIEAIPDTGTITVTTRATPAGVHVEVKDTGTGMDTATLERLGEPFFTTKPVGKGMGLGLSISTGIIERHHGRLQFDSRPGVGTTVIVEVPYEHS
jgi:two-component system, NtrC family, sensor kinase